MSEHGKLLLGVNRANNVKQNVYKKPYRFAVMIAFAMPWPIIPHPNPTAPYIIPWEPKGKSKSVLPVADSGK